MFPIIVPSHLNPTCSEFESTQVCLNLCVCLCVYPCVRMCASVCVCVHACLPACLCVCVCVMCKGSDTRVSKVNFQKLHKWAMVFFFSFQRRIPVTLVGERKTKSVRKENNNKTFYCR